MCREKIILPICWRQSSSESVNNVTSSLISVFGMCNGGVFVQNGFRCSSRDNFQMKGFFYQQHLCEYAASVILLPQEMEVAKG